MIVELVEEPLYDDLSRVIPYVLADRVSTPKGERAHTGDQAGAWIKGWIERAIAVESGDAGARGSERARASRALARRSGPSSGSGSPDRRARRSIEARARCGLLSLQTVCHLF